MKSGIRLGKQQINPKPVQDLSVPFRLLTVCLHYWVCFQSYSPTNVEDDMWLFLLLRN